MFDARKIKDECVQWIRDWFEENGKGCSAVLGISGGKDSSIAAALCVEALGRERVIGVTMPNGVQPDIDDSFKLINHLGIRHYNVNIGSAFEALMKEVEAQLGHEASAQTRINMAPRLRMTTLYAISQSNNGRVVNTCAPSDGLTGLTDEDNLGFTYAVLDKYIRTGVCEDPDTKALIDRKHKMNLFKLKPIPHFEPIF